MSTPRGSIRKNYHGLQQLPIMLPILSWLVRQLQRQMNHKDTLMLAMAYCLEFLALMQKEEFLVLCHCDIWVEQSTIVVSSRPLKTDLFCHSCNLKVGQATQAEICPLELMKLYLSSTANSSDTTQALFLLTCEPLMRERLVEEIQLALSQTLV